MKKNMVAVGLTIGMTLGALTGMQGTAFAEEDYTVHYYVAASPEEGRVKAIQKLGEMYQEEHPEFHLEIEAVSDRTAYLQKLRILASSDELPDLFDSDADTFFQSLVESDQVCDIDALYDELGVTDKIYDNAKDYQRLSNGFLGLICWQANTEYFWYNKTCFEKAGITDAPKTWDEFFEDCQKLQDAGITPIAIGGRETWPTIRYLSFLPFRKVGNEFIEKARTGEASFGSQAGLDAADFLVTCAQYFQTGWSTADIATAVGLVTSGNAAMTYDGTWDVPNFVDENKELKEDIGYFTLPVYDENDATAPTDYWAHAGIGTAINKTSMNDNLKDFMKFVFENYADLSMFEFNSLPMMETSTTDGMSEFYKELMDNYANVKTYGYCWDVRIDSASNEVLGRETTNLALGSTTPEEWASQLDEAVAQNAK